MENDLISIFSAPADVVYHAVPFNTISALVHFLERAYNTIEAKFSNSHEVTRALITQISDICKQNNIVFILVGLDSDKMTTEMLSWFKGKGTYTLDISIDNRSGKFNNLPYDAHPNGAANALYAQKIEDFIKSGKLLP